MTAARLERRFAQTTVRQAIETLGMTDSEIGRAIGAHRRTVLRYKQANSAPSPAHRSQIEDMAELVFLLRQVFPDEEARQEWLHSGIPALRGRTPASRIREGEVEEVIGILAGIQSGAFA